MSIPARLSGFGKCGVNMAVRYFADSVSCPGRCRSEGSQEPGGSFRSTVLDAGVGSVTDRCRQLCKKQPPR